MNQIHQSKGFTTDRGPSGDDAMPRPERKPSQRLTETDLQALHASLVRGDDALAQRRDLGELYKRVVSMIATLDTGLKDRQNSRASEDYARLSARLDGMQRAVNEMEGVLRIEIEPLLRASATQPGPENLPGLTRRLRRRLGRFSLKILALAGCVYLGSVFSEEIGELTFVSVEYLGEITARVSAFMSPDGGIGINQNRFE